MRQKYSKLEVAELLAVAADITESPGLPEEKIVKDVFCHLCLVLSQLVNDLYLAEERQK